MNVVSGLFFVVVAAVLGGLAAKSLKLPGLIGYIFAGILAGAIFSNSPKEVLGLAEIGIILLLFSIGVEISFDSLSKYFRIATIGATIQIVLVTVLGFFIFPMLGISKMASLIFSLGFSISSTAVLVKILGDRGETDTIHGEIMLGWSLIQDLTVIPIMVALPLLVSGQTSVSAIPVSLLKAILIVAGVILLGKMIVPKLIHFLASVNSRELLLLSSIGIALGTAAVTSLFGISPALGAFLAGVVISESQEHHAIFAETRPLRDLFVALFFVTLGFLVSPSVVISKFVLIAAITVIVLILKALIIFVISLFFKFRGRTAISTSFGLAQVGEFAFVILSSALSLHLINSSDASIGIAVTLLTLIISPILYNYATPFWRKMKSATGGVPRVSKLFSAGEKHEAEAEGFANHIIICGYGRVGKWIGKAFSDFGIPFVVVEYNEAIVSDLKKGGVPVLYGDPTEPEVLEAAGVRNSKAVILAIPDHIAQETLIAYVQTVSPSTKIISRVHQEADWDKLRDLKVDKIVQPEFEAALAIVRSVFSSMGKTNEEISSVTKSLRLSRSR